MYYFYLSLNKKLVSKVLLLQLHILKYEKILVFCCSTSEKCLSKQYNKLHDRSQNFHLWAN